MNKSFGDWEKSQGVRAPDHKAVQCKTCNCEWFEQVRATKVDMYISSSLGQQLPIDNALANTQYLLRCLKCSDLQELPVNISGAHPQMQKDYIELTEELSKPIVKPETTKS
jgi:hypothetical protein